ncbi:hypothetical protein MKX01_041142 [Papaver californicum]|nr:hypothetical protein MKX01_041142 [Papaver californicum]
MEAWIHLFDIFLNSPSPEFEASLWFSSNSINNSTTTTSTNSFLKLIFLLKFSCFLDKFMYIQTLPNAVQSWILSFLTTGGKRFCKRKLCLLAESVLNGNEKVDFWVKKSAHNLLDKMSDSGFSRFSSLNLDGFEEEEEEFLALPNWLQNNSGSKSSVLPWIPLTFDELRECTSLSCIADDNRDEVMEVEELCDVEEKDEVLNQMDVSIDSQVRTKAGSLKMKLLNCESSKGTVIDNETTSVLIPNLLGGNTNESEFSWESNILCSIVLPKFLVLNGPASRVLADVDALLFPLILRKEGLNTHMCDVMSRITKECLLLCGEEESRKFVCLPCHQHLVSDKLVWTEQLFTLFQNILNQNISLTQDSVDHIVSVVRELAGQYSKTLKFNTFLLYLITKCHSSLKHHKLIFIPTIELICLIIIRFGSYSEISPVISPRYRYQGVKVPAATIPRLTTLVIT